MPDTTADESPADGIIDSAARDLLSQVDPVGAETGASGGDVRAGGSSPHPCDCSRHEDNGVAPEGADGCGMIVVPGHGWNRRARPGGRKTARLRVLRRRASDFVLPAAVLAEGFLSGHAGHDFHVRGLLELVDVTVVDEELGYAAGALRREVIRVGVDPAPSGVDAVVAAAADACAAREDVEIVTSDRDDIELLASLTGRADRLSVVVI